MVKQCDYSNTEQSLYVEITIHIHYTKAFVVKASLWSC